MDRKQLREQIEKESKHERKRTNYVNSLMENFCFRIVHHTS